MSVFMGRPSRLSLLSIGLAAALAVSGILALTYPEAQWRYPFIHSSLEAFSSFLAGIIAWHLLTVYQGNPREVFRAWMAFAFLNMGVLDVFHAVVAPGETFVWFHSCAVFVGGLLSVLVWIPARIVPPLSVKAGFVICAISYPAFGLVSVWYPDLLPRMIEQGQFSFPARVLNFTGGLAFLSTSLWFVRAYMRNSRPDYLLDASCYCAIGVSGLLFELSVMWDPLWWWWHVLRFISYGFVAYNAKNEFERGLITHTKANVQKEENQRFRLVVESAPCGMLMVDRDGVITLVNTQVESLFGYDRQDLVGQSIQQLIPVRFRQDYPDLGKTLLAASEVGSLAGGRQLYGLHRDGKEIPVEVGLNPIESDAGRQVLATVVDITERKRAQEHLAHQAAELSRSNAELEQFAYVASHDLQEPLRMVSSYCSLLGRRYTGKLDRDADEFIQFAVEGAKRMKDLIDGLLNYSRVGRQGKPFALSDATDCVNAAIANLAIAIKDAQAEIATDPLPMVWADSVQLMQVFQNLIGNSLKFRGGGVCRIRISAQRYSGSSDQPQWEFSVRDNGIGFDQRFCDRVFVIFQRLNAREEYPGNGMGLAITKKIIERHGGRIWVKSIAGKGSAFFFTLRGTPPDTLALAS